MCGVIGVFNFDENKEHDLFSDARRLLISNQHRGQEGFGLSVITDTQRIITYKFSDFSNSKVSDEIDNIQARIIGIIGHARYATSGGGDIGEDSNQPFDIKERNMDFAFAFNGNIINTRELALEIQRSRPSVNFEEPLLDTSVLQEMIIQQIKNGEEDTKRIQESIHNRIDGQCNIILIKSNGSFTLAKDRWGIRPLAYHENSEGIFRFSSESVGLSQLGVRESEIQHLEAGEAYHYNAKSKQANHGWMNLDVEIQKKGCFFEAVYFSNPNTVIMGEPSRAHRYRFGQALAQKDHNLFSPEDSIVMDVPASARDSAEGYSDTLELPLYNTAITKNPLFNKRSFIGASPEERKMILEKKYIFNPELKKQIEGKKLILIDDSIVRGSTLEFLIKMIKEYYNPSEIHIRIPSPPITGPCYYAMNLKHPNELLARRFFEDSNNPTLEEFDALAEYFGVDSIRYLDQNELVGAIRKDVKDLCLGCINGEYPTPCGKAKFERQLGGIKV